MRGFSKHSMNTTFRPRSIPSRPGELAMSLVCRWSGVSVELGLGERIPAVKNQMGLIVTLTRHPEGNEQNTRFADRRSSE